MHHRRSSPPLRSASSRRSTRTNRFLRYNYRQRLSNSRFIQRRINTKETQQQQAIVPGQFDDAIESPSPAIRTASTQPTELPQMGVVVRDQHLLSSLASSTTNDSQQQQPRQPPPHHQEQLFIPHLYYYHGVLPSSSLLHTGTASTNMELLPANTSTLQKRMIPLGTTTQNRGHVASSLTQGTSTSQQRRQQRKLPTKSSGNSSSSPVLVSSPFHRVIVHHPSELLIPTRQRSLEQQRLLLPMVPIVDRDDKMVQPIYQLSSTDIALGRGNAVNSHIGNVAFRSLVIAYRNAYDNAVKGEKGQLARNLCNYARLSGGRFLETRDVDDEKVKVSSDGTKAPVNGGTAALNLFDTKSQGKAIVWYECGDTRAIAKCSQALRENHVGNMMVVKANDSSLGCDSKQTTTQHVVRSDANPTLCNISRHKENVS